MAGNGPRAVSQREAAIRACYASATWTADGPVPQLREAARATGLPESSVRRWWHAREKARDAEVRELRDEVADVAQAEDLRAWLTSTLDALRARLEDLLNDGDAWRASNFADRARAVLFLTRTIRDVAEVYASLGIPVLGEEGRPAAPGPVAGASPVAAADRIRRALWADGPGPEGPIN